MHKIRLFFSALFSLALSGLLYAIEKISIKFSLLGDKEFFDDKDFPWVAHVEKNWMDIRTELDHLLLRYDELPNYQDISPDQKSLTTDSHWKAFIFYGYGVQSKKNCDLCPNTAALLKDIPGLKTAFFSILSPGKQLAEHRGPYAGVLRYHLGLIVPDDRQNCWIKVGDTTKSWEEGKSLIFDDTFYHQVWNNTDQRRVVLFVDIKRPLPAWAAIFNEIMIRLFSLTPYIQNGVINEKEWEKKFHRS